LLHAPPLASGWLDLINAVRWKTKLSGRLREIAIIRIGYLTATPYIVKQHVPRLALPEGLTLEECAALADWQESRFFDETERAVLAYADAMTRNIKVPDTTFAALRPHLTERQIVELSVLVGTYNMHARVMTALEIDPEPDH
jgi:alkylhydroperoxidase family enzyme